MIFSVEDVRRIYQGHKTQFRVPKREPRCRVRTDHPYTIQGTTSDTNPNGLQITITDIREQRLGSITHAEALLEGHKTTGEFLQAWRARNADNHLDPNCEGEDLTVWVLTFKRGDWTDTPRFLAASMSRGDYTTIPALGVKDEQEALSAYQQQLYTNEARVRHRQRSGRPIDTTVSRWQAELAELRDQVTRDGGNRLQEKRIAAIERILNAMRTAA